MAHVGIFSVGGYFKFKEAILHPSDIDYALIMPFMSCLYISNGGSFGEKRPLEMMENVGIQMFPNFMQHLGSSVCPTSESGICQKQS